MRSRGQVREWHDDDGWGVVDSDATPGGCWTHFSAVLVTGYRSLAAGQDVVFDFEEATQDGYTFRTTEVWPADREPARADPEPPSAAYDSTVTVQDDDRGES